MALRRKFHQTKFFRALIVFGALLVLVIFPPRFLFDPLRSFLSTISQPVERFFSATAYTVRDSASFLASIGDLKRDNERLQQENGELMSENAALREFSKENAVLRRELGLLPRTTYDLAGAEVIGRGTAFGESLLVVDRGFRHGLKKNMPVIVDKGVLIGRVSEVFPFSSTILLLTHPSSAVNGETTTSGAKGIIKGEHGLGLLFDVVLQSDTLAIGDSIMTSGLDVGIPRGLLVGTLQEPGLTPDRLYQRASLVSPVQFEDLRYVFVIKNIPTP